MTRKIIRHRWDENTLIEAQYIVKKIGNREWRKKIYGSEKPCQCPNREELEKLIPKKREKRISYHENAFNLFRP